MELLYSAAPDQLLPEGGWSSVRPENDSRCCVSSRNVLALTVNCGRDDGLAVPSSGYHVLVVDLNTPWDIHVVASSVAAVSCLQWDAAGARLLLGFADGRLQLLRAVDHHINKWTVAHSASVDRECVVDVVFFHTGKKIGLAPGAASVLYNDIFQSVVFAPTLRQFGGQPADGYAAVTASGQLACYWLGDDGSEVAFKRQDLSTARGISGGSFVLLAAMSHSRTGGLLVACSDGLPDSLVACYQVSLQCSSPLGSLSVEVQQLPSVLVDDPDLQQPQLLAITQLMFQGDGADEPSGGCRLLVVAGGPDGSQLDSWQLGEQSVSLPGGGAAGMHAEFFELGWRRCGVFRHPRPLAAVSCSRVWLEDSCVLTAGCDGQLFCLQRDSLTQLAACAVIPASTRGPSGEPPIKVARSSAVADCCPRRLCDVALSASGLVAVATDSGGQLHVFGVPASTAAAGTAEVPLLVQLEYCMVSGLDVWDVLIASRPSAPELVCDALADKFQRQPAAVQQFYLQRHLAIKACLYRMQSVAGAASSGSRRLQETNALLMLRCAASLFHSFMRNSSSTPIATAGDCSLACGDALQALVCSKPVESVLELDKVVALVRERDAAPVDSASLAQLQNLCQWVADVALQLLSCPTGPLRDRQCLQLLRELLVLVRRWGQLRPSCLPVFHRQATADQLDVLAVLFKLLTRLLGVTGAELDAGLVAECAGLPPPALADRVPLDLPSRGALADCLSSPSSPKCYSYYEPVPVSAQTGGSAGLPLARRSQSLAASIESPEFVVDSLRHLRLGSRPGALRHCTRCSAVTSARGAHQSALAAHGKMSLLRCWDQRWARACICGGNWVLQSAA